MNEEIKYKNIDNAEEQGQKNILKYFDRIHDKLFTFNNILIAGYFTLSKIDTSISIYNIIFPITNLVLLVFIEYQMMELSRAEANIKTTPINDLDKKLYSKYGRVNWYSLIAIISTAIIVIRFLWLLLT